MLRAVAILVGIVISVSRGPSAPWSAVAKPWIHGSGGIAALNDSSRPMKMPYTTAPWYVALRRFSLPCVSSLESGTWHLTEPGWKLALHWAVEMYPPERYPRPTFCCVPGLAGTVAFSKWRLSGAPSLCQDVLVAWVQKDVRMGRMEPCQAFIPPWLPARLDFWSQAKV